MGFFTEILNQLLKESPPSLKIPELPNIQIDFISEV